MSLEIERIIRNGRFGWYGNLKLMQNNVLKWNNNNNNGNMSYALPLREPNE